MSVSVLLLLLLLLPPPPPRQRTADASHPKREAAAWRKLAAFASQN